MASLQQRGGWFHLLFRYRGRQYSHALKTKDRREADALRGAADRVLLRVRRRELPPPPPGASVPAYLLAGGVVADDSGPAAAAVTLAGLADRYLAAHANGALEENSLTTVRLHLRHVLDSLGRSLPARDLSARALQGYLDARGRMKGKRDRPLSPETLKKEVASVRAAWNWGVRIDLVAGPFPGRGLTYPKADERPPFQTRDEILRKVARGGLAADEVRALWDCLFLTKPDLAEFLSLAKGYEGEPFLYPMVAFAAHTGARRSELMRMRVDDVDLDAGSAVVRERKRVRGQRTTRRVPISGFLAGVLRGWLARHPGGQSLFRLRTPRPGGLPLGQVHRTDAQGHFRRLVRGTAWEPMRGWHVLRHSFVSVCAADGVDQRVLQSWVGHLSAATHRRYTHLIPSREREIIAGVFG